MESKNDQIPWKLLLFAFITLVIGAAQANDHDALIITKLGSIQGVTQVISNAHGSAKAIHKFLGIPYAIPPIDSLRFAPPRPHKVTIKLTDYELKKLPHEKQFASQLKATISVRLLDCNISTS